MIYCFCKDDVFNHKSNATSIAIQWAAMGGNVIYGNELNLRGNKSYDNE